MLNPSDNPPDKPYPLQRLQQLVKNYPFAFWGTVWAGVLLVGSAATVGMFYAGPIENSESEPQPTLSTIQEPVPKNALLPKSPSQPKPPIASKPAITPKPTPIAMQESIPSEGFPLSIFGGLALGCAAGSFVVAQLLRKSNQGRHSIKRVKSPASVRKKRRRISQKEGPVSRQPQPVSSEPREQTPKPFGKAQGKPQPTITYEQEPQVTVLSAEESHPLDGREENLAEMLDLRKRKSLAALMRGK